MGGSASTPSRRQQHPNGRMKVPVPPESPSPKDSLRPVRPPLLSRKSTVMCVGQPKLVPDNSSPSYFILTGDIGGTNSRLTLHEVGRHETVTQGGPMPGVSVFHKEYLNCNYPTFQDLLKTFFAEAPARTQAVVPAAACFAVAGPVDGNAVAFTNRAGWVIDGNELQVLSTRAPPHYPRPILCSAPTDWWMRISPSVPGDWTRGHSALDVFPRRKGEGGAAGVDLPWPHTASMHHHQLRGVWHSTKARGPPSERQGVLVPVRHFSAIGAS